MTGLLIPTAAQLASTLLTAGFVLIAAACCGAIWLLVDWAIDYHSSRVYQKSDADRRRELEALKRLAEASGEREVRLARLSTPAAKSFHKPIYQDAHDARRV